MKLLRNHWYDLGAFFSVIVCFYIFKNQARLTNYQTLMWLSLVSLFLHQLEEYRIVGTFPGMVNTVMYKSKTPDRYPLNTNTAFIVNVILGWTCYLLAALLAEKALWLGIATIMVSFGNIIAHTIIFNLKSKKLYNAGLASCWLFFVPCICFFVLIINKNHLATFMDYLSGITLGVILNIAIVKIIDLMADSNTTYIFTSRNVLLKDRRKG